MTDAQIELEKLRKENRNLTHLAEITRIINSTLDIGKLLNTIMQAIKEIMNTEASSLLFYDEKTDELVFKVALGEAGDQLTEKSRTKTSEGIVGWCARNLSPVIVNDVYSDERFNPSFDKITGFKTRAVICAPLLFKGRLIGVIQGINPTAKDHFNEEDMKQFLLFADQAVLAVQNAILFEKAVEEKRIQNELSAAKSFQQLFLRPFNGRISGLDVASESIAAREVGGEFYDIIQFDDRAVGFLAGDIHQKGIPGAISASFIAGAAKAFAKTTGKAPLYYIRDIENFVMANSDLFRDVSFFYSLFSPLDKTMEFINTGFAYPILLRGGKSHYLKFNTHSFGGESGGKSRKVKVRLETGDLFIILTDGIINLKNEKSHLFGLKRAMDVIAAAPPESAAILEQLKREASEFTGRYGRREDMTFICTKVL